MSMSVKAAKRRCDVAEGVSEGVSDAGVPSPLVCLWLLRILARVSPSSLRPSALSAEQQHMLDRLGVTRWRDPKRDGAQPRRLAAVAIHRMLAQHERLPLPSPPPVLKKNMDRIADMVGLSAIEQKLLVFAVTLHSEPMIRDALDMLGRRLGNAEAIEYLATLVGETTTDISAALHPKATLARAGLLKLDRDDDFTLRDKLEVLSRDFVIEMLEPEMRPDNLLRGTVNVATPAHLSLADYGHIDPSLHVLKPYLSRSLDSGRTGVNILVYGPPGTGKSQLARVMAAELGCSLYEVACEDSGEDPINGERRLRAAAAAQYFFAQRRAMLVFDEMEDVFNDANATRGKGATGQVHKGWVNRFLESNTLPIIWLSNDVGCLDPAFVRRFDQVIELGIPPRPVRERILKQACGHLLDEATIRRLGTSESLSPAVTTRAAAVVSIVKDDLGEPSGQAAMEMLVNQTLRAQGYPKIKANGNAQASFYDPAFTSASVDLAAMARGLAQARGGRVCLFGPPGTGKTAYGQWLAEQLQLPLHMKRASDLLSMYLGGTEQNIAEAFTRAQEEGAILLLDEVDSFLQDRRGASRHWETTQVNEMLTQMEAFTGIFIASTNLMDNLDQASLRRFDMKVRFDYLTGEQAWRLLQRYCGDLGLEMPDPALRCRLNRLDRLTPGDYALVGRQHAFRPLGSAQAMVDALHAECGLKGGGRAPMGFV